MTASAPATPLPCPPTVRVRRPDLPRPSGLITTPKMDWPVLPPFRPVEPELVGVTIEMAEIADGEIARVKSYGIFAFRDDALLRAVGVVHA